MSSMDLNEQRLGEFLDSVAARSPTPGGGAVASVTAALAASLAAMVLRYSQGKKSLSEHAAEHEAALDQLRDSATAAMQLAAADAEAYGRLNALWKLDKADPARREQWAGAVAGAIDPPRRVVIAGRDMVRLVSDLVGKTAPMLDSDLAIAAVLAEAAARAGAWNVRINLPLLEDSQEAKRIEGEIEQALSECASRCREIEQACKVA